MWRSHDTDTLFRMALQASPTGTIVIDAHGNIILANAEAARLFGYTTDDLHHQPIEMLVPARLRNNHVTLRNHYADQASMRLMGAGRDLYGLRRDGSEFPVEIGLNPVTTDAGRYVIATVIDLTPRQRAEELFRMTVEASPTGMIVVDVNGTIVLANGEALRLFGYASDELLHQPIELLVPQRHHAQHTELRRRYAAQAHTRPMGAGRDLTGRRKDGSEFPLEIGLNPIETSDGTRIIASVTDLTTRHAADQLRTQIAKIQAHLAAIVESSDDAIISEDLNGIITSWNTGACKMFGYTAGEMIGRTIEPIVPADMLADARALRNWVITQNRPVHEFNSIRHTKNGKKLHVSLMLSPIPDDHGVVTGVSKVARDVSEQARTEQTLRERSAQLAHSNAELQQFANSASHDLQEPLRAIAGCVELLRKRYAGQLDARADEYIAHAIDSTLRMRQLIDDLLLLSRVDSSKAITTTVDCHEALRIALLNLSAAITENDALVETGELPMLVGDKTQLVQLFQNLIGNAIKFRNQTAVPRVVVTCVTEDGHHHLRVSDNGIGIEPRHTERIFGLFERLHSRRAYPGTGIGLALCAKIVAAHRGQIWVESTPGQGSTFHILLPTTPAPSATSDNMT